MSRTILHRPARILPPPVPSGEVVVPGPPQADSGIRQSWWAQLLFPLVSVMGTLFFIVYRPDPIYIAISVLMAVASISISLAMVIQQRSAVKKHGKLMRGRYRALVARLHEETREVARQQDAAARFLHPGLRELWAIACRRARVWERRLEHADFLAVAVGRGRVSLVTPVRLDGGRDPLGENDAELAAAATRLLEERGTVPDQPIVIDLRGKPVLSLVGPAVQARPVAINLVLELATLCSPDDLVIVIHHPPEAASEWDFAKWLPHVAREERRPLMCSDAGVLADILAEPVARRVEEARRRTGVYDRHADEPRQHLLLVLDGYSAASPLARLEMLSVLAERARDLSASLVVLTGAQREEPPRVDVRLLVQEDGSFRAEDMEGRSQDGWAQSSNPGLRAAIARRLAPLQLGEKDARTALSETCRLVELLGGHSARSLDIAGLWAARQAQDLLRVPIGVGPDGRPEMLDLKEAGQDGMGPHGLVVGATGSGKSELLRTLVTGLALTHDPEALAFVLVDFKGGAAFAGLAELPHVAGVITNLADDLTMVDRMYSALFGEMQRRQTVLRDAGNLDSAREYQKRRASGQLNGAKPLPYLLVIVDEFGELLATRPDFGELFVAIGRVGRSLGMHLLLASQRLEQGRMRGLESHLSYRICLRTFSAAESQAAIGTTDAYRLPPVPGSAYLQVHTAIYERFKAALVTAPDRSGSEALAVSGRPLPALLTVAGPLPLAGSAPALPPAGAAEPADGSERPTEMAVAVKRVREMPASTVHQVWLPPLDPRLPLGRLLPPVARHTARGLQAREWPHLGMARVPVGLLDLPLEQAQKPFAVDFTGWAGHLAVVGAPQTGRSTFLRSLALALIVTHTPDEARIYAIDYGGGGLFALASAPHVGDVAGRLDPNKVRRTIAEVWALLDEREGRLRELGIDSPAELRARRADGSLPADVASDVFLLVDGWGALREEAEDLEQPLRDIAARGLRVAVHLVLTANRWVEIRPALRDNIPGRLELRLNDPTESEINRQAAAAVPAGVPGRMLTQRQHQLQVGLPDVGTTLEEVVAASRQLWPGEPAPKVRLLPPLVRAEELPGPDVLPGPGVPVGVDEMALAPVLVDLSGTGPHFFVLGDSESGKTTFLRTWMAGMQERAGADRAMFLVIDYRRTLLGVSRSDQLWAYCGAAPAAMEAVRELATGIVERLPGSDLAPEAIAARSWWEGPDFYVVVDDYDLVATSSGNPLLQLLDVLAQGRDLGLHVVLARRVGGMSRAGMEPVLNRLRELHTPGLLMSGEPTEGPVMGAHKASPQPPGRGLLVRRRERAVLVQVAMGAPDGVAVAR